MARRNLRPVAKDERQPASLTAVLQGTERQMLVILRHRLAARIDQGDVPVHALAALVKQFRDVDGQIRAIDARRADGLEDGDVDGIVESAEWDETAL
jgi:hypothetical protein